MAASKRDSNTFIRSHRLICGLGSLKLGSHKIRAGRFEWFGFELADESLILFSDFHDGSFVSRWILGADVPVDLISIGMEVNVCWPSIDSKSCSDFRVPFGIDSYGQHMLPDGLDKLRIFEGFLFEHTAWGTVVAVEMDQHGFAGSLGQFHRGDKIFRPSDFRGVFGEPKIC